MMTEQEWLESWHTINMEKFLRTDRKVSRTKQGRRKLRLFACACFRRVWHLLRDEQSRQAVKVAEKHADGKASKKELEAAREEPQCGHLCGPIGTAVVHATVTAVQLQLVDQGSVKSVYRAEVASQVKLLHDIFGNPFRPVTLDPLWLTPTTVAVAHGIYDDRAFDRMPILADALQDAGCEVPDILDHCRGEGPHVRGCWVVDAILGKT
jgi:hypothetical protein